MKYKQMYHWENVNNIRCKNTIVSAYAFFKSDLNIL